MCVQANGKMKAVFYEFMSMITLRKEKCFFLGPVGVSIIFFHFSNIILRFTYVSLSVYVIQIFKRKESEVLQ